MLRKILEKVFSAKKFTQCKISCTLKIDVFKIPDNINIGKLISKNELLFLDQANSSSDPSQILIQQFPIPRAPLPVSPSLSIFNLAYWNPSSTPSSPCSTLLSLFCNILSYHAPQQVLKKPDHMPRQANQIYFQAICRSEYLPNTWSDMQPIKNLSTSTISTKNSFNFHLPIPPLFKQSSLQSALTLPFIIPQ